MDRFVSLRSIMDNEELTQYLLSSFSNHQKNKEVEQFLQKKAVIYEKQDISRTTLVLRDKELAGYFSIANKPFSIKPEAWNVMSRNQRRKYVPDDFRESSSLVTPQSLLLGQLGRNFNSSIRLPGDQLLNYAEEQLYQAYQYAGGRFFWLECLNKDYIVGFYERNGYQKFDVRDNYCLMIKRIKEQQ